jgi:hypothetical protein
MDQKGAVGLEHKQPDGLREPRGETAAVEDFTTGDE